MKAFQKKNELSFALLGILFYVVLLTVTDAVSDGIGITKAVTFPALLILSLLTMLFVSKNGLSEYYGLGRIHGMKYRQYLYFIPLIMITSSNIWNGVSMRYPAVETVLYVASMLCVGFLEELIFRGLLFNAMAKKNLRTAIIVSSITFGFGHIINLLSGAALLPTILQIVYASAIGYMFTVLFIKSKSLIPGMATHSAFNALSAFSVEGSTANQIMVAAIFTMVAVGYALYLNASVDANKAC